MTEITSNERFVESDDQAQAAPRRRATANGQHAPASESKPNIDILATLRAARQAAEAELEHCESRASELRAELGLQTKATTVHHTNVITIDDGDDEGVAKPVRAARATKRAPKVKAAPKAKKAGSRLARRTPEQIATELARIVSLVKKSKAGLRAEEIRKELNLLPKEMPRLLKEGVKSRSLKSKGEKRATVYSAA